MSPVFSIYNSYRPDTKTVKAGALSHHRGLILSPIQWSQELTTSSNNTLLGFHRSQRTPLIHSAHISLGTVHPGANSTLSLQKDCLF